MFYRLLLLLGLNILLSQSFFNNVIGNEIGFQSGRTSAMGQTHFINSNTSAATLRNPARLSFINKSGNNKLFGLNLQLDFGLSGLVNTERRSIDVQDFFGDFLTEADYVSNDNIYSYNHFGLVGSFNIFSLNATAGLSYGPWSTLDYSYSEEVRGSQSFDDGVIGIRDPIIGYHILNHEGDINLRSLGFAIGVSELLSIGISHNYIYDGSYNYKFYAEKLTESDQNLSSVSNTDGQVDFDGDSFLSVSAIFRMLKNSELSIGYEKNAIIQSNNNFEYSLSSISGLPNYVDYEDISSLEYVQGLAIDKPEKIKIGFIYNQGSSKNGRLFSVELIKNNFLNYQTVKDYLKINMGIEYISYDTVFRFGISYKEPALHTLSPLTMLCFGTARQYSNLIFDIGLSYSYQNYHYQDIFPVDGDVRPDYDNVHESNWNLVSTVSYQF